MAALGGALTMGGRCCQTDNVWDIDCSSFFPFNVGGAAIYGAYFVTDATIELMRHILRGIDRGVLQQAGVTTGGH